MIIIVGGIGVTTGAFVVGLSESVVVNIEIETLVQITLYL